MTQTLLLVILFVAAIGTLPWIVRRLQQRRSEMQGQSATTPRVLSAVAVGPHQRVVTVEVGPPGQCVTLILGVTPQTISCLHALRPVAQNDHAGPMPPQCSFDDVMAQTSTQRPNNGAS